MADGRWLIGMELTYSRAGFAIRNGTSQPMATTKPPETLGSTRSTLPRPLREAPISTDCAKCTASSTEDPFNIRKSLESRMPLRQMFSERAEISAVPNFTVTGRCRG